MGIAMIEFKWLNVNIIGENKDEKWICKNVGLGAAFIFANKWHDKTAPENCEYGLCAGNREVVMHEIAHDIDWAKNQAETIVHGINGDIKEALKKDAMINL